MIKLNIDSSTPIKPKILSNNAVNLQATQSELAYGHSAYDLAVANGFKGTVSEWLESLQGQSPYINTETNTWWAYDQSNGWYDTNVTVNMQAQLLRNLVIQEDDCICLNCGDSTNVMGD